MAVLVRKVAERKEAGNDVYYLAKVNGWSIINNNYHGFRILVPNLERSCLVDARGDTVVYSTYTDPKRKAVLLYCPENQKAVLASLSAATVASIPPGDEANTLSPIHFWDGSTLIVSTYHGTFVALARETGAVILPEHHVASHYPDFHSFWRSRASAGRGDRTLALCRMGGIR